MTSVPASKSLNNDTIFKWEQVGPLNITALEESGTFKLIDEDIDLVMEQTVNGEYQGQNSTLGGIGRLITADGGVIEGQFKDGIANGYARMIDKDKGLYVGFFKDGMRHGFGNMTMKSGIQRNGYWNRDLFYEYEDWYKLVDMFNSTPAASPKILEIWKSNRFDIGDLHLKKEIQADQSLPFASVDIELPISMYGKPLQPLSGKYSGQYQNGKP